MKLSYEEFMSIVPEETKKMVNNILPYLWIYLKRNKRIKVKNKEAYNPSIINKKMQMTIATLLGACEDQETKSIVEGNSFISSKIQLSTEDYPVLTELEKKEIFEQASELFFIFDDETKYATIQPIDILKNVFTLEYNNYYYNDFLSYIGVNSELISSLEKIKTNVHREIELKLEKQLFSHLPVSTINYIETASKIRDIIVNAFSKSNMKEQELLKYDDSYIVPISLLFALFEYEGIEKNEIVNYFKSKGISFETIRKHINGFSLQNVKSSNRNLESVDQLYKKYWLSGINQDVKEEDIQVVNILENVLNRDFTGVVVIDKLFEKLGTTTEEFSNLKENVDDEISRKKIEEETNYAKNFYKELKRDTKDFINFATQTYQLLLKKMAEGKHNTDILNCENDADTLALYIASHFYNTDFETFYVEHGVTFDKVMKLLGITITKEEIEKETLNQKLVVDVFKNFVTSGVNVNKRKDTIVINDIVRNLCNRDFNKSMIMENIFEEIRRDIDLPANFMNDLDRYLEQKESERKRLLTEKYFDNKSTDIYYFLEKVCKAYTTLSDFTMKIKLQDEEIVTLSFLYALFDTECETRDLFQHMGLTKSSVNRYLGIDYNRYYKGEFDIDLIISKFEPFIKQISHDDKTDITIKDICESIFSSQRTRTLELSKLLNHFNLSYDDFKDLSDDKANMEKDMKDKLLSDKADKLMNCFNTYSVELINEAVKILQALEEESSDKIKSLTSTELADLAMLLSILGKTNYESYHFFNKYHITRKDVLNLFEISNDFEGKVYDKKYDFKYFLNYYQEYSSTTAQRFFTPNDLLGRLLNKNSNVVNNSLQSLGLNTTIFTRECLSGKDYESTLTIDDRCKLLDETVTEEIHIDNTTSILTYGNSLANHTNFINDSCTDLSLNDANQNATKSIQSILDKVYSKRQVPIRKQTWFEKMMGIEVETSEEIDINASAIKELKSIVSNHLAPIYADINTFDSLVKYLEIYRKKVIEHRNMADEKLLQLNEQKKKLSEDDFGEILRLDTYIKALEAKRKGFALTEELVKQYIYKAYLLMQNELVTITGLEISIDVLIPLLEAELLVGNGIENQVKGAKVTANIVKLLGEIVNRNTEGIRQGLDSIKGSGISEEVLASLNKNITLYLNELNNIKDPNSVKVQELPHEPKLELYEDDGPKLTFR